MTNSIYSKMKEAGRNNKEIRFKPCVFTENHVEVWVHYPNLGWFWVCQCHKNTAIKYSKLFNLNVVK